MAEDIAARFLNVISLFNGTIPIIAIQLNALRVGQQITLAFTTVVNELSLGLVDEDEEQEPTDRSYWEERGTKATVAIADELLKIIKGFDPAFELKFNKFYIGLAGAGQPNNFALFRPNKSNLRMGVRLDQSDEVRDRLEQAGLDLMDYESRSGRYRIRLTKTDVEQHFDLLKELLSESYQNNVGH